MKIGADAAINHVGLISSVLHLQEVFVLEALDLGVRHAFSYRLVLVVHSVV